MNAAREDEVPLLGEDTTDYGSRDHDALKSAKSFSAAVLYFMAIHFLLAFCEMILVAPLIKLFEESLCLAHYDFPSGGVEESLCKIPEIQRPLATIRGWKAMFDTLPVLLVAVPMGKLGDKYGRRKIMALSLIGVAGWLGEIFTVCAFPRIFRLQVVWLSSILLLCGGGLNAASAFMWAMASESIESDRRSHAFYYIFSAFYVAELLGSFIASATIEISPWIPCGLAFASVIVCLLLLQFMPDLRKPENGLPSRKPIDEPEIENSIGLKKHGAVDGLVSALSDRNVLLIIPVFLVGIFRYTTLNILIQYASIQFGVKISTGATFYTETAVVNIVLFLFLIPRTTSHIRMKCETSAQVIDLFLVRCSVFIMSLGCICIGLAPSSKILPIGVSIFSSGFGSRVTAISLISYWISDDSKATIYAAITVLESLGHAFGDPSMQQIFAASLRLSRFWHALPFFVAAVLYFFAGISTSFLQIEKAIVTPANAVVFEERDDDVAD